MENSEVQDLGECPVIKQWLGCVWLEQNGGTSLCLTRRMSNGDSQSSQLVWPLGLCLLEPPSGRQCQRGAVPAARQARPYRRGGLRGSPPWGFAAWSPNNNALDWEEEHGNVITSEQRVDNTAGIHFCLCSSWWDASSGRNPHPQHGVPHYGHLCWYYPLMWFNYTITKVRGQIQEYPFHTVNTRLLIKVKNV